MAHLVTGHLLLEQPFHCCNIIPSLCHIFVVVKLQVRNSDPGPAKSILLGTTF
ncbi:unnamed protein product [Meloidogyne enterolobii]|uniref:Uncharacterized protein n=1 Tax=Meloidogyne enterolobii TaxID=390850 RepID=A0ACB0ZSJ0_MELEN